MRTFARLAMGLLLAALTGSLVQADEPAKAQFQTVKFEMLSKTAGSNDWSDESFLKSMSKQGDDSWELLLTSDHAALFRKAKDGPKWEYKSVRLANGPLTIESSKDTDAYSLILDRMAADGYAPCAVNELGTYTLFKRVKEAKPEKTEFQVFLLADLFKSRVAPASRWGEKEFIDAINKQGGEGWEVCICNFSACVFQKTKAKWEYKLLKVTNSPLKRAIGINSPPDAEEAATFTLILEGLEAKDWRPSSVGGAVGQDILLKRKVHNDKK